MNRLSLQDFHIWLSSYIDGFADGDGSFHDVFDIKRLHSGKVAVHCRIIAEELRWTAHESDVAEAAGLFHDTGRFSQFAEFGTFSDQQSVDHGVRGAEVLDQAGVLDTLDPRDRMRIIDSVRCHNRREIPQDTSVESLPFVRLVRDADKLDIYRIVLGRVENGLLADHLQAVLGITAKSAPSRNAIDDIYKGVIVSNDHLRSVDDFILMLLSWVYDFNYTPTIRRVGTLGYFDRFAGTIKDHDARLAAEHVLKMAARKSDA